MITITRVLDDIINHQQIPLDRILSRYFSPGYRQRTDNKWEGLDALLSMRVDSGKLSPSLKLSYMTNFVTGIFMPQGIAFCAPGAAEKRWTWKFICSLK